MPDVDDFPAAHSMDTTWFAVDDDGQVAVLVSHEGGAVPERGFASTEGGAVEGPLLGEDELLAVLVWVRSRELPALAALLPDDEQEALCLLREAVLSVFELAPALYAALGVWTYDCPANVSFPYERRGRVRRPLAASQLPPAVRTRVEAGRLALRFAEVPVLAPGAYVPVSAWMGAWVDLQGKVHAGSETWKSEAEQLQATLDARGGYRAEVPEPVEPLTDDQVVDLVREALQGGMFEERLPWALDLLSWPVPRPPADDGGAA